MKCPTCTLKSSRLPQMDYYNTSKISPKSLWILITTIAHSTHGRSNNNNNKTVKFLVSFPWNICFMLSWNMSNFWLNCSSYWQLYFVDNNLFVLFIFIYFTTICLQCILSILVLEYLLAWNKFCQLCNWSVSYLFLGAFWVWFV